MNHWKSCLAVALTTSLLAAAASAEPAGKPAKHEHASAAHEQKRAAKHTQLLTRYDRNGNGALDPDERATLRADRKASILARYDADHSGHIEEPERIVMRTERATARYERLLSKLDTNGDAALALAELPTASKTAKHPNRARRLEKLHRWFAAVDANGDQLVHRAEVEAFATTPKANRKAKPQALGR